MLVKLKSSLLGLGVLTGIFFGLCVLATSFDFSLRYYEAFAQSDLQVVKYRDLELDLGDGVTTKGQLSLPAIGEGPFPGILLIQGSGANDMNETGGLILIDNKTGVKTYPEKQTFFQISQYLSERGFAVLKYDKRGITSNFTIDFDVWGNTTFDDLKQDASKALNVLLQQPEVNSTKKVTLIGHSEGTMIAPRIAIENPDKVKNIVLMGAVAGSLKDLLFFQIVNNPLDYVKNVLKKGDNDTLTINEITNDPILQDLVGGNVTHILNYPNNLGIHRNESSTGPLDHVFQNVSQNTLSVGSDLKTALIGAYQNVTIPTNFALSIDCREVRYGYFEWNGGYEGCPKWMKSHPNSQSTLSIIGNISSDIGVLILQGENDSATPLEQGLLLQQRLTGVNHPDHLLITYPNLGHSLSISSKWISQSGPMEEYVLRDMFEWLFPRSD
ncbi:alpha/beta hydrolase [Candidatus Nitrosocosmicus franklandus]|uniref:Alpha/beta hydrolase family protein n=1 Tax=Candidatus Nitrosocosmicus franklandianus TaxID=1798806 RepID=A0A484ICQ8_9ARCH|nr:alpha/beta fold hydrolase [Candidatus Nitrosocosmicus franklandus]VFJ14890.1 Alpha/beta hydrolase family protein [Candidatus Nitrosocosmicus franklandus]